MTAWAYSSCTEFKAVCRLAGCELPNCDMSKDGWKSAIVAWAPPGKLNAKLSLVAEPLHTGLSEVVMFASDGPGSCMTSEFRAIPVPLAAAPELAFAVSTPLPKDGVPDDRGGSR